MQFTKPLTKRQKALRRREEIRHSSKLVISAHAVDKESSPTISYAEGLKASSRLAETANRVCLFHCLNSGYPGEAITTAVMP